MKRLVRCLLCFLLLMITSPSEAFSKTIHISHTTYKQAGTIVQINDWTWLYFRVLEVETRGKEILEDGSRRKIQEHEITYEYMVAVCDEDPYICTAIFLDAGEGDNDSWKVFNRHRVLFEAGEYVLDCVASEIRTPEVETIEHVEGGIRTRVKSRLDISLDTCTLEPQNFGESPLPEDSYHAKLKITKRVTK